MLWTQPIDDRLRLACLHGSSFLRANRRSCERLSERVFLGRTRGGTWGQRREVLAIQVTIRDAASAPDVLQCSWKNRFTPTHACEREKVSSFSCRIRCSNSIRKTTC